MSLEVLAVGSDNLVRLDALTNASTGAFVNNAVVTFTLKDASGSVLVSAVSMPYVAGSNGRYEGVLTVAMATLVAETLYTVEITATQSGATLFRRLPCIAKYRSAY
jgi:hypothetical protein